MGTKVDRCIIERNVVSVMRHVVVMMNPVSLHYTARLAARGY